MVQIAARFARLLAVEIGAGVFGEGADRGDRLIDLVRDARGDLPDRTEPARLRQFLARGAVTTGGFGLPLGSVPQFVVGGAGAARARGGLPFARRRRRPPPRLAPDQARA